MHQIRQFMDNRDRFYKNYLQGQSEEDKEYFRFGRAMDYEIKDYYTVKQSNYFNNPEFAGLEDTNQMIVMAMMEGYKKYYEGEYFQNFKVVNYRVPFENFLIYASPDLTAEDYEGNLWIVEIKTSSQPQDLLAVDFQTMTYVWAKWKWDYKIPKGVLKRILRKPGIKQKKKEKEQDFKIRLMQDFEDRGEFYYLSKSEEVGKSQISDFEKYMREICRDMDEVMKNGNKYKFYKKSDADWGKI